MAIQLPFIWDPKIQINQPYPKHPFFKPKQNYTALVIKIIKIETKRKITEKINLRGREGNSVATSGAGESGGGVVEVKRVER